MSIRIAGLVFVVAAIVASACSDSDPPPEAMATVIAEGLLNPIGLSVLQDGSVLVAEEGTGDDDASAGVSWIRDGRVDRVVSGLPSGRDSGDLSGVPLVGVSPDGTTVYTAHFGSEALLTFPAPSGKTVSAGIVLGPTDLDRTMTPLNRVALVNPFDVTFARDGTPVVTDASSNGVATSNPDGTTVFIHRFGELTVPGDEDLRIEAVPTGIARVGDEYYVTLTGGCPYPDAAGRLVAIDGERNERVVVDGLDMPIDVTTDTTGTVWVLEFADFDEDASCFSGEGYLPGTGRLSRLGDEGLEAVLEGLDFPGAVAAAPDGSLYVTEVFGGRVLRITVTDDPEGRADAAEEPASPWRFVEVAEEEGLDFSHSAFREGVTADPVAMMGGGLCWIDADTDGRLDLYLVDSHEAQMAGPASRNALFRNTEFGFEDVTERSGSGLTMRGMGCVASDLDNDGDTDLYVTADGPNALLINDGSGSFENVAAERGVAVESWSSAAAVGDVDGDGRADLFVGTYLDLDDTIPKPSGAFPQDYVGQRNHLFLQTPDGTFTDATEAAGLVDLERTLGALFTDIDRDGDLDLYVANDGHPNRLYLNEPHDESLGFRFRDVTTATRTGDSGSGMGIAGGDYDRDGALDLFVSNWDTELHALYRGSGAEAPFEYTTFRIGIAGFGVGETGWGTAWGDFDHDTDLDLVVVNGHVPIADLAIDAEPVQLFGNLLAEGSPGQMRDWSTRTGIEGLAPLVGRGAAVADYDNDGDLDVAINQIGGPAALLRNDDPAGNAIVVAVDPPIPGTSVEATLPDGIRLFREIAAGGSYLSSHDPRVHIGVGNAARPISIEVRWPDGRSLVREVSPGSPVVVSQP